MSDTVKLVLGSVQFGLAYGVAGRGEPVPAGETREVLAVAWDGGIRLIDTAPVYGDIEERLRELCGAHEFEFVSKIPALPAEAGADVATFVRESIERSRRRLGDGLRTLLFHRGEDLAAADGARAWQAAAAALEGSGIRLGGSFYSPASAAAARAKLPLAVAQLPGNVLDQRLATPTAAGLAGVEIHLRSVFLQGLLLDPPESSLRRIPNAAAPLAAWRAWCAQRNLSPLSAALAVARGLPRVSCCLVGVDRVAQLREILAAWRAAVPLTAPALACDDEDVIDPRRWKAA
jgi:aryl-alcohol dehydrogenase-like predicted oxidoreductase